MLKRKIKMKVVAIDRQTFTFVYPRFHCPVCQLETETLTTGETAKILEVDEQTLTGLIHSGKLHVIQTVSGSLRVCKDSLAAKVGSPSVASPSVP